MCGIQEKKKKNKGGGLVGGAGGFQHCLPNYNYLTLPRLSLVGSKISISLICPDESIENTSPFHTTSIEFCFRTLNEISVSLRWKESRDRHQ